MTTIDGLQIVTNNPQINAEPPSGTVDEREIHALELRQLDVQASLRERVASLEAIGNTLATKEDLAKTKLWAMFTVLVAAGVVISRFWPV